MKTLTKPVKSRLSSPSIYGYELDWTGTRGLLTGKTTTVFGDPPLVTWVTEYYTCVTFGYTEYCCHGETWEETETITH